MSIRANGCGWVLGLLTVAVFGGCDGTSTGDKVEEVTSALVTAGKPQGFTCGLGYYRNCVNVDSGNCNGVLTGDTGGNCANGNWYFNTNAGPGYHLDADGDRGLGPFWGLYHQAWTTSDTNVNANSASLLLPKGTACGFKDNCNDHGELCMGLDAAFSCPSGWNKMVASDINAPSSCNGGPGGFVWCEYQDPGNVCTGTCQTTDQPYGTVCGISDNDRTPAGKCLGVTNTNSTCPPGYTWHGRYDDGRSVGHGVSWCSRS